MLYIRLGSRFLFINTHDVERMKIFYTEQLDGTLLPFEEAINKGTEHCTVIFLLEASKGKPSINDVSSTIFFPHGASVAHSEIFNHGLAHLIVSTQLGPGSIIMRSPKKGENLISSINENYDAKEMDFTNAIFTGDKNDSILSITNQSLHLPIKLTNTITKPLLINEKVPILFDQLRKDGLLYITKEIEDNQWCELKINIYDVKGNYQMHYKRLIHILSHMDLGMILGESWTRDHALSLFSVLAYQVRLFTLYTPIEIKSILKGLEYDDGGNRLVDFDLYYKNKKVSSSQLKTDTDAYLKEEKGVYFRRKLMEQLSLKSVEYIRRLEKSL
jgi:hypothetical protein